MEAERRRTTLRKRKPLADRTNLSPNTRSSSSSLHKLPPPPTTTNSTSAAAAASKPAELGSSNQKREQHRLIDSSSTEARNKRRKKLADTTAPRISVEDDDDGNKENVDADANNNSSAGIFPDVSSSPSTPSVRQPLSPLVEPLTVYTRRQAGKKKGKEKVINEAFSCPPVERERNESNKPSFAKVSKCRTELPKKRRIKERVVSKDYFEQQRVYFAEIDKCELPEEEVSESELSDH